MTEAEIERLSDQELTELATKLCRQVMSRRQLAMPLAIPGENKRPVGFLIPAPVRRDPPSQEYLDDLHRRMTDPNATFLTLEEFFAALDAEPSTAASA
jgi:hypothetical protein